MAGHSVHCTVYYFWRKWTQISNERKSQVSSIFILIKIALITVFNISFEDMSAALRYEHFLISEIKKKIPSRIVGYVSWHISSIIDFCTVLYKNESCFGCLYIFLGIVSEWKANCDSFIRIETCSNLLDFSKYLYFQLLNKFYHCLLFTDGIDLLFRAVFMKKLMMKKSIISSFFLQ